VSNDRLKLCESMLAEPDRRARPCEAFLRKRILEQLKARGEGLDHDLAATLQAPLQVIRNSLAELASRGDVVLCRSNQFRDGETIKGLRDRAASHRAATGQGRRSHSPATRVATTSARAESFWSRE